MITVRQHGGGDTRRPLTDMKKNTTYMKPQLRSQKIELGVYGQYNSDGGDVTMPYTPVHDKPFSGDFIPHT